MIALAVVLVGVFTALPIVASFGLSFFSWDVITPPTFIGVDNYTRLAADTTVLHPFGVTLLFGIAIVVLQLSCALGLALLVNQRPPEGGPNFFRTAFYLPLLASTAAVGTFNGLPVRLQVRGPSTTTSGCSASATSRPNAT